MNKFCTIISISLSISCFVYMFHNNIFISCLFGFITLLLSAIGFFIEGKATYFWNTKLNKFIYYISKNDKEYNIESKEVIYTCMTGNEYKFEKNFNIYPTSNKLDRITERFIWSAPSNEATIEPLVKGHEIVALGQQELWTLYSVYFHHTCEKHKLFKTGSVIRNLIDEKNKAVPFLSASIDRKTKLLIMKVCFNNVAAPQKATFKVVSKKNPTKEIYSKILIYDDVIKGFSISVDFPRQNWKYVISW